MSLPRDGFEGGERSGRRGMVVAAVALLVLAIGWGYVVVTWGGDDEPATAAESTHVDEQTLPPEITRQESRAVPSEHTYAASEEQREPSVGRGESSAEVTAGATSPQQNPGEEAADESDASAGDPAEIEGERIQFAAAEFVSAAYGYSGEDPDEYNQGVGRTVVWPAFYSSAGGAEIARYAEQVESTGTEGAAKLTSFEAEKATPDYATGYAYFETGEGHDPRTGELTGKTVAYHQEMTLSRVGDRWKVEATGEVEEV